MLFKCMLRELIPMELYFNVKPLAIFSNYDLSVPIFFKDEKDIKHYLKMAERNALYLRQKEKIERKKYTKTMFYFSQLYNSAC